MGNDTFHIYSVVFFGGKKKIKMSIIAFLHAIEFNKETIFALNFFLKKSQKFPTRFSLPVIAA